jgi:hypothetical protein
MHLVYLNLESGRPLQNGEFAVDLSIRDRLRDGWNLDPLGVCLLGVVGRSSRATSADSRLTRARRGRMLRIFQPADAFDGGQP